MNKVYITSPIYYVNGKPHIGHAHTSVMCDSLKRANIMNGNSVFYTTGVDEHGQKNQKYIEDSGLSQEEYLDKASSNFKNLFDRLNIAYDFFVRTTNEQHKFSVETVLQTLFDKKLIFKKEYDGLYCEGCEQFKTDSDLDENGLCVDHQKKPLVTKETNYFLSLNDYQDWLVDFIKNNPEWIAPDVYQKEILNMLKEPLPDLCISRPKERVSLGIELPFDRDYVAYVWFDALINYISNIGYPNDMERFNTWWPSATHVMAKDIIKTHCIYWPIMLKALELEPPKKCLVHGYWVGEGGLKMSKSLGNAIVPGHVIDEFGVDSLRFFMTRSMGKSEAQISNNLIADNRQRELGNNIGNLYLRTLTLVKNNFGGKIPTIPEFAKEEIDLLNQMTSIAKDVFLKESLLGEISNMAKASLELGKMVNVYFDKTMPWKLAKDPNMKNNLASVIVTCLEGIRLIYELLYPIMPDISNIVIDSLGNQKFDLSMTEHEFKPFALNQGGEVGEIRPLFPKEVTKKTAK